MNSTVINVDLEDWIPTSSNHFPKNNTRVLVTSKYIHSVEKIVTVATYIDKNIWEFENGLRIKGTIDSPWHIQAWMPLPKAYRV